MKRGAVNKTESRLVNVWVPREMLPLIDLAVRTEDSDRSKFIRRAIRDKLFRLGICAPNR
jgi:metal-responsive CopG/Arc/MetJ family transcriptional regulator